MTSPTTPNQVSVSKANGKGKQPSERRSEARRPLPRTATIFAENAPVFTPGKLVLVNDISMHGIGFTCSREVDVGDVLRVRIDSDQMRINARIKVVRCDDGDPSEFMIGAEFIEEKPEPKTPSDRD